MKKQYIIIIIVFILAVFCLIGRYCFYRYMGFFAAPPELFFKECYAEAGGIRLGNYVYGAISDDELCALYSLDGRSYEESLLVPEGAVLLMVRKYYWIGYYDRGAHYEKDGETVYLERVYFTVTPTDIEFRAPSPENINEEGDVIHEKVIFHQ